MEFIMENQSNNLIAVSDNNFSPLSGSDNLIQMNGVGIYNEEGQETLFSEKEQFAKQLLEKENCIIDLQSKVQSMIAQSHIASEQAIEALAAFDRTILIHQKLIEELKQKLTQSDQQHLELIRERDQALQDLRNVESAFADVQRKYERSKTSLESLKENEKALLQKDQELVQKILIQEKEIESLRGRVPAVLVNMHEDYDTKIKELESENVRLHAQFRKMEMKVDTLENDLEQKTKENAQLSALCDELISGKGPK